MVQCAMIAALYAVLTMVSAAMGLAYGPVQFRISEALTLLPVFTPAAIPGLALGCLIANLGSPLGPVDWIFGTAATLLAGWLSWSLRNIRVKNLPMLSALAPVLCNALIIGLEITWLSGPSSTGWDTIAVAGVVFLSSAVSVGLGELVVCILLGLPLTALLERSGAAKRIFN